MKYHYKCKEKKCKLEDLPEEFFEDKMDLEVALGSRLVEYAEDGQIDMSSPLVWVERHGMFEEKEVKCPICGGATSRVIQKTGAVYIRGNGYLDKKGCLRDMNLYKLMKDDPYGHMREPGEKDDLADRIRSKGKHQTNPQHFYSKKTIIKPTSTD